MDCGANQSLVIIFVVNSLSNTLIKYFNIVVNANLKLNMQILITIVPPYHKARTFIIVRSKNFN